MTWKNNKRKDLMNTSLHTYMEINNITLYNFASLNLRINHSTRVGKIGLILTNQKILDVHETSANKGVIVKGQSLFRIN